jgi:hypothetical protein
MTRPPAPGPHARHRSLETPGPTGYNDHGDPGHRRRRGVTPGPLGQNDHGMPLSTRRHPVEVYDDNVALLINHIIDQANRAIGSAALEGKLQFCLDLAKQNRRDKGEEQQKYRDLECYFLARIGAIEEKPEMSQYLTDHATAWAGGFSERNWVPARDMPPGVRHPSSDRLAKWSRHDDEQPVLGPYEGALRWAANGAADRLRCSDSAEGDLQRHRRPTHHWTMTAFHHGHTD